MWFNFSTGLFLILLAGSAIANAYGQEDASSYYECIILKLATKLRDGLSSSEQTICKKVGSFGQKVFLLGDVKSFVESNSVGMKLTYGVTKLSIPMELLWEDDDTGKSLDLDVYGGENGNGNGGIKVLAVAVEQSKSASGTAQRSGTHKIIVLRISDTANNTPSYSKWRIGQDVFSDAFNLDTAARKCSKNQLRFAPATGSGIVNGVLDVTIAGNMSFMTKVDDRDDIVDEAIRQIPNDADYRFIMIVFPRNTDHIVSGAWAFMPGELSAYEDTLVSDITYSLHELGHNLGMAHSGNIDRSDDYGDPTCVMGGAWYDIANDDDGQFCFNAAKTITPASTAGTVSLVTVNDNYYGRTGSGQKMFVKIQGSFERDLFMMYHKTEGITSDVNPDFAAGYSNNIVIVEQSDDIEQSWVKASLSAGQTYTQYDYSGGGTLKVKVCSISNAATPADVANVVIWVVGRTAEPSCNDDPSNPPVCLDTKRRFMVKDRDRNCWFAKFNKNNCNEPHVSSMCPLTCGVCDQQLCLDGTGRMKYWDGTFHSCKWIARKNTPKRCSKWSIRQTCRATCGYCD